MSRFFQSPLSEDSQSNSSESESDDDDIARCGLIRVGRNTRAILEYRRKAHRGLQSRDYVALLDGVTWLHRKSLQLGGRHRPWGLSGILARLVADVTAHLEVASLTRQARRSIASENARALSALQQRVPRIAVDCADGAVMAFSLFASTCAYDALTCGPEWHEVYERIETCIFLSSTHLTLRGLHLAVVPELVGRFNEIAGLYAAADRDVKAPRTVLRSLDLSKNPRLRHLPPSLLASLPDIEAITLADTGVCALPPAILRLQRLRTVLLYNVPGVSNTIAVVLGSAERPSAKVEASRVRSLLHMCSVSLTRELAADQDVPSDWLLPADMAAMLAGRFTCDVCGETHFPPTAPIAAVDDTFVLCTNADEHTADTSVDARDEGADVEGQRVPISICVCSMSCLLRHGTQMEACGCVLCASSSAGGAWLRAHNTAARAMAERAIEESRRREAFLASLVL